MKLIFSAYLSGIVVLLIATGVVAQPDSEYRVAYDRYTQAVASAQSDSDFRSVIPLAQKATELGIASGVPTSDIAILLFNQAYTEYEGYRFAAAARSLKRAIEQFELAYGENPKEAKEVYELLAKIGTRHPRKNDKKKRGYVLDAVEYAEIAFGQLTVETAMMRLLLADYWLNLKNAPKARQQLSRALNIFEELEQTTTEEYGIALFRRGRLNLSIGKSRRSVPDFLQALEVFDLNLSDKDPMSLTTHQFLVEAYERTGKSAEATKHCQHIASIEPESGEGEPVAIFRTLQEYPIEARRRGHEGWVVLNFTIGADGRVHGLDIKETSGKSIFEKPALEAVSKWRFKPGYKNGQFVSRPDQHVRLVWQMAKR